MANGAGLVSVLSSVLLNQPEPDLIDDDFKGELKERICTHCGKQMRRNRSGENGWCSKPECTKDYIRCYMHTRYHNDPEFRQRMIKMAVDYQKRKRKGVQL